MPLSPITITLCIPGLLPRTTLGTGDSSVRKAVRFDPKITSPLAFVFPLATICLKLVIGWGTRSGPYFSIRNSLLVKKVCPSPGRRRVGTEALRLLAQRS